MEPVALVGNFDVLLEEDLATGMPKIQQKGHVGNNRFSVLVNMNAKQGNDDIVVERIIDIVCRQVEPNGRFLLRRKGQWYPMTHEDVKAFVRAQVDHLAPPRRTTNPTPLAMGISSLQQAPAAAPSHCASAPVPQTPPNTLQKDFSPLGMGPSNLSVNEIKELSMVLKPLLDRKDALDDDDDGDKKRRRRSSLLRRSVSESVLFAPSHSEFDKKKSVRKHTLLDQDMSNAASIVAAMDMEKVLQEEEDVGSLGNSFLDMLDPTPIRTRRGSAQGRMLVRSGSFDDNKKSSNVVTTAEALDIIFAKDGLGAVFSAQQHTGNNRLGVMMDLKKKSFEAAESKEQQLVIADELLVTVQKHWGGRFLMENPDPRYVLLNDDMAKELMIAAFRYRQVAGVMPVHQAVPAATPSASNETAKSFTLRQFKDLMPSSQEVRLRERAREALFKRKQRQGVTSKIRNLTHTRVSSDSVGMGNVMIASGFGGMQQQQQFQGGQVMQPQQVPNTQPNMFNVNGMINPQLVALQQQQQQQQPRPDKAFSKSLNSATPSMYTQQQFFTNAQQIAQVSPTSFNPSSSFQFGTPAQPVRQQQPYSRSFTAGMGNQMGNQLGPDASLSEAQINQLIANMGVGSDQSGRNSGNQQFGSK